MPAIGFDGSRGFSCAYGHDCQQRVFRLLAGPFTTYCARLSDREKAL